jgi:hypothetical protein
MHKRRLRAPSPALVISLIALFVALGGTTYAATTALINGSHIKPHSIAKNRLTNKAVKQLKGNRGPKGATGATGAQGVQGVQGLQGIQGARGPSDVYEVELSATTGSTPAGTTRTLTLSNLPAGAYAIYGKAAIAPLGLSSSSSFCTLTAGSDADTAYNPLRTDATWIKAISTQLTHTFSSTGSVTMTCEVFSDAWELGGSSSAGNTRIIAVAAGTQHKTSAAATLVKAGSRASNPGVAPGR